MGFQYQKLIVYRRAMEYDRLAAKLIPEVVNETRTLQTTFSEAGTP